MILACKFKVLKVRHDYVKTRKRHRDLPAKEKEQTIHIMKIALFFYCMMYLSIVMVQLI